MQRRTPTVSPSSSARKITSLGDCSWAANSLAARDSASGREPAVDRVVRVLAEQRHAQRDDGRQIRLAGLPNRQVGNREPLIGNRELRESANRGSGNGGSRTPYGRPDSRLPACRGLPRFPIPDVSSRRHSAAEEVLIRPTTLLLHRAAVRPASVREIFLRATSASSTSSHAAAVIGDIARRRQPDDRARCRAASARLRIPSTQRLGATRRPSPAARRRRRTTSRCRRCSRRRRAPGTSRRPRAGSARARSRARRRARPRTRARSCR